MYAGPSLYLRLSRRKQCVSPSRPWHPPLFGTRGTPQVELSRMSDRLQERPPTEKRVAGSLPDPVHHTASKATNGRLHNLILSHQMRWVRREDHHSRKTRQHPGIPAICEDLPHSNICRHSSSSSGIQIRQILSAHLHPVCLILDLLEQDVQMSGQAPKSPCHHSPP